MNRLARKSIKAPAPGISVVVGVSLPSVEERLGRGLRGRPLAAVSSRLQPPVQLGAATSPLERVPVSCCVLLSTLSECPGATGLLFWACFRVCTQTCAYICMCGGILPEACSSSLAPSAQEGVGDKNYSTHTPPTSGFGVTTGY